MTMTATYSPDDNKLRLTSAYRLDAATFARVKAAGFKWAPKQEQFIAPMWSPDREDLLIELCGEIEDDDRSLVDRAEERADRFEGYRERRGSEAAAAHQRVRDITEGIPLGQPILVGHHSERHARKAQERIESGMRKAVSLWETSQYWRRRAAGALRHAKYKERPDVRYRRIKSIEADKRKSERLIEEATAGMRLWSKVPRLEWDRQDEAARYIAGNSSHYVMVREPGQEHAESLYSLLGKGMKGDTAWRLAVQALERRIAHHRRWIAHYDNRLAYERAMLGESGGLAAEGVELEVGGRVLYGETWSTILRVNKKDGVAVSVSTNRRTWPRVMGVEEIKQYEPPSEGAAEVAKAAKKLPPLCNYQGEGFMSMTKAEYDATHRDYKGTLVAGAVRGQLGITLPVAEGEAPHRVRSIVKGYSGLIPVFLTDAKVTRPPKVVSTAPAACPLPPPEPHIPALLAKAEGADSRQAARQLAEEEAAPFKAMKQALRDGVQIAIAPQLFPTPPDLAARMVDLAEIQPGCRVGEFSAGTGRIVHALRATQAPFEVVAVEINDRLAQLLRRAFEGNEAQPTTVHSRDFLEVEPFELGLFDCVVINPPFEKGADIKHITHAMRFLKPGGRLVALCANGPRQQAILRPLADQYGTWEDLPADTFESAGTAVRTALLKFTV